MTGKVSTPVKGLRVSQPEQEEPKLPTEHEVRLRVDMLLQQVVATAIKISSDAQMAGSRTLSTKNVKNMALYVEKAKSA